MKKLNFPEFNFNFREKGNQMEIFDSLRGRFVLLTPEEWVRQNSIAYLIKHRNIPEGMIQVEGSIQVANLKKRCDILVYDKKYAPVLLIECKETKTLISQKTFDQVCRYNISLKAPYLLVTNGIEHYCLMFDFSNGQYRFLDYIPDWEELNNEEKKTKPS